MKEKFLPIGSVVMLTGGRKELMITGYCMSSPEKPGQTFDYCGCLYPEGVLSSDATCIFNHSQIQEVFFEGYVNEKSKLFLSSLKERAYLYQPVLEEKQEKVEIERLEDFTS